MADGKVLMVNYVRGVAELNKGTTTLLKRIAKDVTEHGVQPNDTVPQSYLLEFQKVIEAATNKVFSGMDLQEALAETLDTVVESLERHLGKTRP